MSTLKKLSVNCGFCDMTKTSPETLDQYESIRVNCGVFASNRAVAAYPNLHINCGSSLVIDGELSVVNGPVTITRESQPPEHLTTLVINGTLHIEPDSRHALSNYENIYINGMIIAPRNVSLHTLPFPVQINGKSVFYPTGSAVHVHTQDLTVDAAFLKNAPDGVHVVTGTARLLDTVDPELFAAGRLTIIPTRLLISEENSAAVSTLFADVPEQITIPAGHRYVEGTLELAPYTCKSHGTKLYIDGSLIASNADGLDQLESLIVTERAILPESALDLYFDRARCPGEVLPYCGELIQLGENQPLTANTLERAAGELTVLVMDDTEIAADVTEEQLAKVLKLHLIGGSLTLEPFQLDALDRRLVRHDNEIHLREHGEKSKQQPEDPNVIHINCGSYSL